MIDKEQVFYNIDICLKNKLDFIFLINHNYKIDSTKELTDIFYLIKEKYHTLKVGVNFLQLDTLEAVFYANNMITIPDAIWCDNGYAEDIKKMEEIKIANINNILYFGGVDFKYQKVVPYDKLEETCKNALNYIDVITTSGKRTGFAAKITKIIQIRNYIGNNKMAIASGINEDNIGEFNKFTDYLLVASSITNSLELINEKKLKNLINGNFQRMV